MLSGLRALRAHRKEVYRQKIHRLWTMYVAKLSGRPLDYSLTTNLNFYCIGFRLTETSQTDFSQQKFFIPFGRFSSERKSNDAGAEVLIGRESQRAFLIDSLTGAGHRGAYLVTGRRGVGKTTFVENCLREYQSNVFRRFLRSRAGRSPVDIAIPSIMILGFLFILLTASDLLEFVMPQVGSNVLLTGLAFAALIPITLPVLYAAHVFRQVGDILVPGAPNLFTLSMIVAGSLLAIFGFPAGSPAFSVAMLLVGMSGTAAIIGTISYRTRPRGLNGTRAITLLALVFFAAIVLAVTEFTQSTLVSDSAVSGDQYVWWIIQFGFIAGPLTIVFFLCSSAKFYYKITPFLAKRELKQDDERPHLTSGVAKAMARRFSVAAMVTTVILAIGATLLDLALPEIENVGGQVWVWIEYFICVALAVIVGQIRYSTYVKKYLAQSHSGPSSRFVPASEALLILKGFAAIVISLQLAYPVFQVLPVDLKLSASRIIKTTPQDNQNIRLRAPTSLATKLVDETASYQLNKNSNVPLEESRVQTDVTSNYFTVFHSDSHDEVFWFLFAFILCFLIFFLEYEWINRPFIPQRQAQPLDRGARRDYQAHHDQDPAWAMETGVCEAGSDLARNMQQNRVKVFRAMERASMPYVLARFWLPEIIVRVNLGFDKLDHRGVTHAMLFGLSAAYRKIFRSWSSPIFLLSRAVLAVIYLFLAVLGGKALFDMPYRIEALQGEDLKSIIKNTQPADVNLPQSGNTRPVEINAFSKIEYCRWLDLMGQENFAVPEADWQGRALLPKIGCSLVPNATNSALTLLFAPLLKINIEPHLDPYVGPNHALPNDCYLGLVDCSWGTKEIAFRPIYWMTHINNGLPELRSLESGTDLAVQKRSISFRLYHAITFLLLAYLANAFGRHFAILPYKRTLSMIDGLARDLVQAQTERRRPGKFSMLRVAGHLFSDETELEQSRDRLDPRTIELAMMHVLDRLQDQNQSSLFGTPFTFSLPSPEVHFVFDELDKIGGVVGAEDTAHGVGESEREAVDAERKRTYALHALLSDMKRVISSAPARFIFVGGRSLHDEWVRDINRAGTRQPLLSGIFDSEIYLPSLLLDMPRSVYENDSQLATRTNPHKRLDARVREYLVQLHDAAKDLDSSLAQSRMTPFFALPVSASGNGMPKFSETDVISEQDLSSIKVVNWRKGTWMPEEHGNPTDGRDTKFWLLDDFCRFLAFRSAGSPKKLRELLSVMIRPSAAYALPSTQRRFEFLGDRDMIVIDERELYRIQFVGSVFKHIDLNFGQILAARDDKVAINVFFLFDYLMKLHDRAFSLASLERLDELAHIHRAPDLRRMLDKVISSSAQVYFHRMLNGLYSLRFQSDLAMEIRYLSRISEPEMAALNFTLDESQELKTTYVEMQEASGESNPDIISALGELYEYDQAYDVARGHYERAIRMVDDELVRQVGGTIGEAAPQEVGDKAGGLVGALREAVRHGLFANNRHVVDLILRGTFEDRKVINYYMPWLVRRLRLMMQIGLTFEQVGDTERAQAQYYSAHMLSRAITDVAFEPRPKKDTRTQPKKDTTSPDWKDAKRPDWEDNIWLKLLLENLTLIYQPLLSSAWISEKLDGAVDTSIFMVEQELIDVARRFEFVWRRDNTKSLAIDAIDRETGDPTTSGGYSGENFSLITAELHNKAGDLYFYKGRENLSMPPGATLRELMRLYIGSLETQGLHERLAPDHKLQTLLAYLPAARSNYCVALHSIRRFAFFRRRMSSARLNKVNATITAGGRFERSETHRRNYWPSFVNLTASSSLVDLAETKLAGSTTVLIARDLANLKGRRSTKSDIAILLGSASPIKDHMKSLNRWFEQPNNPKKTRQPAMRLINRVLGHWEQNIFGTTGKDEYKQVQPAMRQVSFRDESDRPTTLFLSIFFGYAGADYIRSAGYHVSAAAEFEVVLSNVSRFLKNIFILSRLSGLQTVQNDLRGTNEGPLFAWSVPTVQYIKLLLGLTEHVLENRLNPILKNHEDWRTNEYNIGGAVPISLGVVVSELEMTLASLIEEIRLSDLPDQSQELPVLLGHLEKQAHKLRKVSHQWFCDYPFSEDPRRDKAASDVCLHTMDDAACPGLPGSRPRARLVRILYRHHFPALTSMAAQKALVDHVVLARETETAKHAHEHQLSEALGWLSDLVQREKVFDAPMHFTPTMLAESCALALILRGDSTLRDGQYARDCFYSEAIHAMGRANGSFSMGKEFYSHINRLYYLYDDFNDRARHSAHAQSMFMADMLGVYGILIRRNEQASTAHNTFTPV